MMRTEDEIEELFNEAAVRANEPTQYPGMTYEQGVFAALEWLKAKMEESPLD